MMALAGGATLRLYRALSAAAAPVARVLLRDRVKRGKEAPDRLLERMGVAAVARPAGALIWMHGASVGESLSALPLAEALLAAHPDAHLLMTTGTVTSAQLMAERLPKRALHQFVPVDSLPFVQRFLNHWRPDAALWLESELWPNLIGETAARGIPIALVNGRMSERSHRGWRRARPVATHLLGAFTAVLAQDRGSAERLSDLGARGVVVTGNLKTDAAPLPADAEALKSLTTAIGERPTLLAASTHSGEETLVLGAHKILQAQFGDLLTIIAPRHPLRGGEVAAFARGAGLETAQRSLGEPLTSRTQVYVADTLGELGLFYRLARAAFVGGSLVPHGGQNPYEPARLNCPILHGPHIHNFEEAYAALDAAKGAMRVQDAVSLAQAAMVLLGDKGARTHTASRAREALGGSNALAATLDALAPLLRRLS